MRRIIIERGEDGYFVARVPSLPGCFSQGKTKKEAEINIQEAMEGYILAMEDDGIAVPPEDIEDA